MIARRLVNVGALAFCLILAAIDPRACNATTTPEGLVLDLPGYVVTSLAAMPSEPLGLDLDAAGNLFLPTADGIYKVTPGGSISLWSNPFALDLAFTPEGSGYGAGGGCNCLTRFAPVGTNAILHQDSLAWAMVNLGADGTLYAAIAHIFQPGHGLYQVDRATGQPSLLVSGGPGPGGTGAYGPTAVGADGKLHAMSYVDPATYGTLFRLDGSQFTAVASIPNPLAPRGLGGSLRGLAPGPSGTLHAATVQETLAPQVIGVVYILDPALGTATRLASGYNTFAIAYDASTGRLYVAEGSRLKKIWVITKDSVPTTQESWGRIKARYRN